MYNYVFDRQHPAMPVRLIDRGSDASRILLNVPTGYTVGPETKGCRFVTRPNGTTMLALVQVSKPLSPSMQMQLRRALQAEWPK